MSGRVLDVRPGGVIETLHDDSIIVVEQNVDGVLRRCGALRNESGGLRGFRKPETFRHVASIPLALVETLRGERGMDVLGDEEALFKFLNDPQYAYFRTWRGRV